VPACVERTLDPQLPTLEGEIVPLKGKALRRAEPGTRQGEEIPMQPRLNLRGGLEHRCHLGRRKWSDGPLPVHANGGGLAAAPPRQLGDRVQRKETSSTASPR
jgi:hypothetical protein